MKLENLRDTRPHQAPSRRLSGWCRLASLVVICLAVAHSAAAQTSRDDEDPTEKAQYRSGALAWSPALVFSSGYDTNVYREPLGFKDYENFVVPQIEGWWLQPGLFVKLNAAVEVVRFKNNVGATNSQAGIRLERRQSLLKPWVNYNRRRTNANPTGFEVGYKSLRLENDITGGMTARFSPQSQAQVFGRFTKTGWDADAIYQGSSLREKLNRATSSIGVSYAHVVTPLISLGGGVDVTNDRFKFAPERNGNTLTLSGLLQIATPARIFGTATIGSRSFKSSGEAALTNASEATGDNRSITSRVNLGYGTPDGTLLKLTYSRNIEYSIDVSLGFYVESGYNFSVARRLGTAIDSAVFVNRVDLSYRASVTEPNRVDIVNEYGTALAYRLGQRGRVGVTVEHATKTGVWGYKATRLVAFLTYGSGRFQRLDRPTPFER